MYILDVASFMIRASTYPKLIENIVFYQCFQIILGLFYIATNF